MWNLKKDANGAIALDDKGMPLYVNSVDGQEKSFDINELNRNIATFKNEARTHREGKEVAEQKLAAFGDLKPEEAAEAITKVKAFGGKQLIEAEKLEQAKQELKQVYEGKLSEAQKQFSGLQDKYNGEKLTNAFARSKFIGDKLILGGDMVRSIFGSSFKVEDDGSVRGYLNGQPLHSSADPTQPANFDEALAQIVAAHPQRETILKSTARGGAGSNPGGQGGAGNAGGKVKTRSQFDEMNPVARAEFMKTGGDVVDD